MKRNTLIGLSFVFLVVIYASLPLFGSGYIPTHDGEYHIIRFWQFFKMLSAGYAFPRWAPDLNSGYGLPLFTFHYPFPNYVGALFHFFGATFVDSVKLVLAFGYILACLACFAWLKKLFSLFAATTATIVFAVVPYWFVDIYVRGSVGEVWAIAWFFCALYAVEKKQVMLIAISSAFLILSHNIMAMLLIPAVCFYAFIRNPKSIMSVFIGVFISSYFWLPALVESRYMVGLNSVDYRDHFPLLGQLLIPSWGTGFSMRELTSDEMSFQLGIVPLIVYLLVMMRWKSVGDLGPIAKLFSLMGIIAFFLMLEASMFIWEVVPVLPLLQYPWRLLVFVLPLTAFFTACVASKYPRWITIGISVMAVFMSVRYMRPVVYAVRTDEYYLSRREFTDGMSSIGNTFSTIWTEWKRERFGNRVEVSRGTADVRVEKQRPLYMTMTVQARTPAYMRVNTLYFPGWNVYDNGNPTAVDYTAHGIVEFWLEPGTHRVDVRFENTPVRGFADAVSIVSLAVLAILGYTSRYAYRHKHVTYVRGTQRSGDRAVYKRTYKRPR